MMRTIRSLLALLLLPACLAQAPDPRTAADAPDHSPPVIIVYADGAICSAVVFERDTLMTAGHCIADDPAVVYRAVGLGQVHLAHRAWASDTADIGLIFLDTPFSGPVEPIRVGPIPDPFEDTWVRGFGCGLHDPSGGMVRLDTRPVVSLGLTEEGQLGFLGALCHGDSGGAYFDAQGRLLGINSTGYGSGDGIHSNAGSAVPVAEALPGLP